MESFFLPPGFFMSIFLHHAMTLWRYTVCLMLIRFNNQSVPEPGNIASSFVSDCLKWISGTVSWSDCACLVLSSWRLINTYALLLRRCILTGNRTLSWPGLSVPPFCSNILTDRHMKSGSGPIEALVLQAQTKPAVGSYGATYVSLSLSPYEAQLLDSRHAVHKALYR